MSDKKLTGYILLTILGIFLMDIGYAQTDPLHQKCGFGVKPESPQFSIYGRQQTSRPEKSHRYLTQDQRFLLHYDVSGPHAVPAQQTYPNEVPDYIIEAGRALSKAWAALDSMGFKAPPMDEVSYQEDPPGGAYDIYFKDFAYYGYTYPENLVEATQQPNDYSGYIEIENDFSGFLTEGIPAVQVTCAHELFHLFHLGYAFKTNDLWWYEISSSWFEDLMYPGVDDYVNYINYYFNYPQPLHSGGVWAGYRAAHYGFVLSNYQQPTLLETIWENFKSSRAYEAIDLGLQEFGASFLDSYMTFAAWNFATNTRAVNGYGYPDASKYPLLTLNEENALTLPDSLPFAVMTNPHDIEYLRLYKGVGNETYFELQNSAGSGNGSLGSAFGLFSDLANPITESTGRSYAVSLITSGENGIVAAVNAGSDTASLSIQRINVFRPFPNPYVMNNNTDELNLYVILGHDSGLQLEVFNLLGRKVHEDNFNGSTFSSGKNSIPLQVRNTPLAKVSNGVYFLRLQGNNFQETTKLTILR